MFSSFRRDFGVLLALLLVAGLAACTTTNTGSGAVQESSIEASKAVEPEVAEVVEVEVMEQPEDTVDFPSEEQIQAEPATVIEEEQIEETVDVTTAPVEQVEIVEGVEEAPESTVEADEQIATESEDVITFPVQTYEIEEPSQTASKSEADAELDRLRRELEATESELERMQAEEEQREYSSSQAISSADSASEETIQTPREQTTIAQAPQAPRAPAPRASTPDLPGKPTEHSIYFGFDQAVIDDQFESVLVAHAEFLKANPELTVEIQGNCDERGSREYNIALGQRRAFSVKRALELLGVKGHRIEPVSFGSEKPVAFGHNEESWRLNRRADIVYY